MASKIEHFVASDGWQYADMADFLLGKKEWCDHNWKRHELERRPVPMLAAASFKLDLAALAAAPVGGIVMYDPNTASSFVINANATGCVAPSFSVLVDFS